MYDDAGCHPSDPTWRSALAALARARDAAERVHLLVETGAFARAVRELWPGSVAVLPHPSGLTPSAPPVAAPAFVLYVPGEPRDDKGHRLLSAVVRALAATACRRSTPIRVLTQGGATADAGTVSVVRLPKYLARTDYEASWRQSHAALLLHDPGVYALRGSGVACDAVASGRPFVCLNGTTLGEWDVAGNVVAAEPRPEAVAHAVVGLIDRYSDYERAGRIAAARFAETVRAGLAGLIE
jgi:hypothetical protein